MKAIADRQEIVQSLLFRHSRESGNPFFHKRDSGQMDSRFRGNDGAGVCVYAGKKFARVIP
jgi:hypothetical protein